MSDSLARFKSLLRELFQLDFADLDFGMYRLFRLRAKEVEIFIEEGIPKLVDEAFGLVGGEQTEARRARLEDLNTRIRDELGEEPFGADGSLLAEVDQRKHGKTVRGLLDDFKAAFAEAQSAAVSEDRKVEVFNHLHAFFSRYYDNADFIPRPRFGRNETYAVPYSGEEVAFHWATKGMHYIKSATHFRDYRFSVDGSDGQPATVHFRISDANLPTNNTKGDTRYFFPLVEAVAFDTGANTLTVPFHYRLPTAEELAALGTKNVQTKILEQTVSELLGRIQGVTLHLHAALANPASQTDETPLLAKRLNHFTRRANQDYFIHPDLGGFLSRELEFYLKDVVLSLEDLAGDLKGKLATIQVIRKVGQAIVGFLHQVESAQNRLFEKPKFVLACDWLVPIRSVPEAFWEEILGNAKQRAAWTELFGTPASPDTAFLKTHPTLVLDTRYFDPDFKRRLLEALPFDSLDEATDGLLVHGENWQALNLMRHKLAGQVDCIYIDPPYNTGSDEFIYKDRYQHSSWLALMDERLRLARELLSEGGSLFASIDDNELSRLTRLLGEVFGDGNLVANVIWQKVFAPKNTARHFSEDHDYIIAAAVNAEGWKTQLLPRTEEANARFSNPDNDLRGSWTSGDLCARNYYGEGQYEVVSPSGRRFNNSVGSYWRVSKAKFEELDRDGRIWWGPKGNNMPRLKRFLSEVKQGIVPQTLWPYEQVGHTQEAKQELLHVVRFARSEDVLNTVKPTRLIGRVLDVALPENGRAWALDFFAGSGTTAHAVIRRNRERGTRTRFSVVEMGAYFDDMVMQRVSRALYCPDWSDCAPKTEVAFEQLSDEFLPEWVTRSPRLVQVLRLESYEDALQNLQAEGTRGLRPDGEKAMQRAGSNEPECLAYVYEALLGASSTLLSVEKLASPFDYSLEALTPSGPAEKPVDLMETAHWLLGVRVDRLESWEGAGRSYRVTKGRIGEAKALIVWRDLDGLDPAADRAFIEERSGGFDRVLVNGDCALPGAESLDALLFERFRGPAH